MIVYLISVRFGFHLCLNSKIFLFVLSLICIFNLSFARFEDLFIYSFILVPAVCFFAMIVYLTSVCFGFHLFFNGNFWYVLSLSYCRFLFILILSLIWPLLFFRKPLFQKFFSLIYVCF